ncbi:MAG: hypothetical protein IKR08_05660 [Firmicutes bacterium]|nr:hypothetical protein [Bacillota bacterium]
MNMSNITTGTITAGSTSVTTGAGTTAQAGGQGQERTFTQAEVNAMLANERRSERAKFADYEDLKSKAQLYDQQQAASQSDLEKAQSALAAVTAERDALKSEKERRGWIDEVAAETKVDASTIAMLSGKTKDELMEQARKLAPSFAQPVGSEGGKPAGVEPGSKEQFVAELFG